MCVSLHQSTWWGTSPWRELMAAMWIPLLTLVIRAVLMVGAILLRVVRAFTMLMIVRPLFQRSGAGVFLRLGRCLTRAMDSIEISCCCPVQFVCHGIFADPKCGARVHRSYRHILHPYHCISSVSYYYVGYLSRHGIHQTISVFTIRFDAG
jgi:hypothetical protein